jgi:hypothetical protein
VMIYYVRRGVRAPDGFHHPYKSKSPVLYKCGKLYKLDLGDGCLVDDRGYIFPAVLPFLFLGYVLSHFGWLFGT